MANELRCKNCGKKLLTYEPYERKYGSPLRSCKKCNQEYIDPRYHELAVTGIPEREFKLPTMVVMLVIGVLITWRGVYLFGMRGLDALSETLPWLLPAVILFMGIVLVIGSIVESIRIISGSKRRKYERLLEESKSRLLDENYINKLQELGYLVQERYTGGTEDEK